MKLCVTLNRQGSAEDTAKLARQVEAAGIDALWMGEAYGFDAVSVLGFLAGQTTHVQLGAAILPIYSRSPALTAMTAAGLDFVSSGRFVLGLGASGPQVVTGWHGVPYDRPLVRTRETIEVCRKVWAREKLEYHGRTFEVPLGGPGETARPLKLLDTPLRSQIPIYVAALGPKNVALAAEIAEGWLPIFYHPDKVSVWQDALEAGKRVRSSDRPPLEIVAGGPVAICGDEEAAAIRDGMRAHVALYVGGMGSPGQNFYNDLFVRYGYEAEASEIQSLYLAGKRHEAEAVVPDEYLRATSLVGDEKHVRERFEAFKASGVTCLNLEFVDDQPDPAIVEKLKDWENAA